MSLLPYLLSELESSRRFYDPIDDLLYHDHEARPSLRIVAAPLISHHHLRPRRVAHRQKLKNAISHLQDEKDAVKINLDVQQFKPEELSVKVVDGFLVVEGKHEERQDEHGYVERQFTRRYRLPDNVDPDTVTSSLSSDGVLVLSAPRKNVALKSNVREIPITHTQAPAVQQQSSQDSVEPKEKEADGDKMQS